MNDLVYVFLDESGNLDFSANGTRHFVLSSVSMKRPFHFDRALNDYKYDCIESGVDIEYFHCYNDRKAVRNTVFNLIAAHDSAIHIDCLVVEKATITPEMQESMRFYPAMLGRLLKSVLRLELEKDNAKEVIVITDSIPVNRRRRTVEKAKQSALARALPRVRHRILHHQSRSHYGLQIADYCSWAIFRKHEIADDTYFSRISPAVRNEFVMFRTRER